MNEITKKDILSVGLLMLNAEEKEFGNEMPCEEGIVYSCAKWHLEQVREMQSKLTAAQFETNMLREALSKVATNLGNGSVVSAEASLPFITEDLPNEVKLVCDGLRRDKLELEARCAVLRCGIENISNLCSREFGDAMVSTAFIHEMCREALKRSAE